MPEVGLTGGIGSGKSTVAAGLVARGAALIDTDAIVRELQTPGRPVFDAMIAHWGSAIVGADGALDRAAVADIVFSDSDELTVLNDIVHPTVAGETAAHRSAISCAQPGVLVILEIPLLVEPDSGLVRACYRDLSGIVVVDIDPEIAVRRLVSSRGFAESDARARIATQAQREVRLAVADFVIDNNGSPTDLEHQIEACWQWASALA